MKKIILGFMILLSTSLFATDISNFDIKGIKLGTNKDEVLKKNGCYNEKILYLDDNKKIIDSYLQKCDDGINSLFLNHKKQAFFIQRRIFFKNAPVFEILNKKIIDKYGKPDVIAGDGKHHIEYYYANHFKRRLEYNDYVITSSKSMTISISINDDRVLDRFRNSITFTLEDKKLSNERDKRCEKIRSEHKKEESNIDL